MDTDSDWPAYLDSITEGDTGAQIAHRAGVPESTVSRWRKGTYAPKPVHAVALSRAYGRSAAEGLIAAGFLQEGDVELKGDAARRTHLREFSDVELAQEMLRRAAGGNRR